MNTIDDFEKVLKDNFVPLKDDKWLIENGYMEHSVFLEHVPSKQGAMPNWIEYRALRDFTFDGKLIERKQYFRIYYDGAVI